MNARNEKKNICISLSQDEGLILFDWLVRFNEREDIEFQHQSEERVLWDMEAVLEKYSLVTLSDDYSTQLSNARERIKDESEDE